MKIKPWQLMQRKDQTRERIVINFLEEIKSFKGTQDPQETTHPLNASHSTRWDTLQEIVHSKQNNSRRSYMLTVAKENEPVEDRNNEDEDSTEEYVLL